MNLNINDTFADQLPADPILENHRRQVNACFSYVTPKQTKNPKLIHVSEDMLKTLGLSPEEAKSDEFLNVFTGNKVYQDTKPFAMCYGGHQFGNWAGQLGDGRAINLFEVDYNNKHWSVQLKGSGETPYSRTADGLAVLRSSVREYLCSEAMYHLGVPGTRALSLSLTGDEVMRDVLYNGNSAYEKGAVVCRVAPSFIRFGNFQLLAARENTEGLKELVEYTIRHFYPTIKGDIKSKTIELFRQVTQNTIKMIVDWQRVGFVHGVMNTDNMSILGETIDYGPYGWLEGYDFNWTPNTTDAQNKRYRFGNQPNIGLWNVLQLANALYPLVNESDPLQSILDKYQSEFDEQYLNMMRSKLGLVLKKETDLKLVESLENNLQLVETDMTIFFRNLAEVNSKTQLVEDKNVIISNALDNAFYVLNEVSDEVRMTWRNWFSTYIERLKEEVQSNKQRVIEMNLVNPKYVFRNYMAQLAIDEADKGDYKLIDELYELFKNPYGEQVEQEKWFAKRPEWARNKVGCSMLSCSS